MAENRQFEHEFLDLKGEGMEDRTFLGGMRLGVRSTLFWALGFASLLTQGVVFVHVDKRTVTAIDDWRVAREVSTLMFRSQSGLARGPRSLDPDDPDAVGAGACRGVGKNLFAR